MFDEGKLNKRDKRKKKKNEKNHSFHDHHHPVVTPPKISVEDRQVIKVLGILKTTMGGVMANLEQLMDKIEELKTGLDGLVEKQAEFQTEVSAAFVRLEGGASSGDTQAAIDALEPLAQTVLDKSAEIDTAIAEAKLHGV